MLADFAGVLVVVVGIAIGGALLTRQLLRRRSPAPGESSTHRAAASTSQRRTPRPPRRLAVKFYLVALLFVVFDVAVVFILPWAAVFAELEGYGLAVMAFFTAPLAVALAYCWGKGALEW